MASLAIEGATPRTNATAHVRWPVLGEAERSAVTRVLDRGVLSGPFAPEVRSLEREFAKYLGVKHCLSSNSGTAALHMAVAATGLNPGDEVIVPAFTFVATPLSVLHHGGVPVFVDIEPKTLGIDPAGVERAITPRTKALMPVHIHGTPCQIDALSAIAKKHNLTLIEDAAQAHGSTHAGKKVGTFGAMGAFSLQSSKSLACGEGGLFVTDDDELLKRALRTRMFGEDVPLEEEKNWKVERALDSDRAYDSLGVGWMYRMTELSAAIARSQLTKLDEFNSNAQKNAALLSARLGKLPGVTPPLLNDGDTSCFHKYRLRLDATKIGVDAKPRLVRDAVRAALKHEGIDAVLWQSMPVPAQKLFREKTGYGKGYPWSAGNPVSYELSQYPETVKLLDSSLVLFSHTCPIAPQPQALIEKYAEAFEAVWTNLPKVLSWFERS
ncbi:MAG: DegT/DnrJ/EryC1/StrS family aminotransferase [Myxococcaceae bacterium]